MEKLSAQRTSDEAPSAQTQLEQHAEYEGRKEKTRVPSAVATRAEILDLEYNSGSKEEEVESVQGTPTGVLCEQVVLLLRYLDHKAAKYADSRHRRSYVELVRNRTRIKIFYQGMRLLTKSEEKRFPKEREVLTIGSDEGTEEEDNIQIKEPFQKAAQGSVRMDVITVKDQLDKRSAKRRKVGDTSSEGRRPRIANGQDTGNAVEDTKATCKTEEESKPQGGGIRVFEG
ncbi:hypothetical protein AXG93_4374s1000 [Marchantia polymorpha subsp. ruderalis]|uniref:Uncharacterized protein n=1 Tax=Marchantia polymorpha subsp. ruderalis TaxID=1480154 RepID=A0A176WKC6_MARPO|nr:hypothetical protein AXG93_4374s1000 [Marchantia polymorpha subsp. ruderalis]